MRTQTLTTLLSLLALSLAPGCATVDNTGSTTSDKSKAAGDESDTQAPEDVPFLLAAHCARMLGCIDALAAKTPSARRAFEKSRKLVVQASKGSDSKAAKNLCTQAMWGYAAIPDAPANCVKPAVAWTCDAACRTHGLCTKDLTRNGCMATSDAMCKKSTGCTEGGDCSLSAKGCVPGSDADCQKGGGCSEMGLCTLKGSECLPSANDHCSASTVACKEHGACSLVGPSCEATSEAMCRASGSCASAGDCGLIDGACEPKSDADCQQSEDCKTMGFCGLLDGTCTALSDAHCKQSRACKGAGACTFDQEAKDCVGRP